MRQAVRLITVIVGVTAIVSSISFVIFQWLFPIRHDLPKVIGIESDAQGQMLRAIVFESSHRILFRDWEGHPHGSDYNHFFLQVAGQPRQELTFLPQHLPASVIDEESCRPVADSPLWISAGFFGKGHRIDVVVFDGDGVRTHREIEVTSDMRHPGHDFWFEDGNRTLRFRASEGVGVYDVVSDTVTR